MSRELFTDEQAHPIVLLRTLTQKYGVDWMEWPPSVLKQTIEKDFKVSVARVNVGKALAAAAVATRDEFWQDWETFHFLCQALNNNVPDHERLQEHTVGQMMAAVDMATAIRKELKDLGHIPQFSEEVARYIAAQALNQGIWYLPAPLEFASKYSARRMYRCKDCGHEDEVHYEDGLCDSCVERFDTHSLLDWDANPQLLKRGWGKNIEYFERNPTAKVKKRFEQKLTFPNTTLQENRTDVCVAKLLVAVRYMEHRRQQLGAQE